jgi:hypothetical protein
LHPLVQSVAALAPSTTASTALFDRMAFLRDGLHGAMRRPCQRRGRLGGCGEQAARIPMRLDDGSAS